MKNKGDFLFNCGGSDSFYVTNIKFRFRIRPLRNIYEYISGLVDDFLCSQVKNMIIYRHTLCTFIIFKSGHINVTGVKSMADTSRAKDIFFRTFPKCEEESGIIIDNISASGTISISGDILSFVRQFVEANGIVSSPSLDPFRFPSVNLKTEFGTISFFQSGKVNLLGLKDTKKDGKEFEKYFFSAKEKKTHIF